MTIYKQRYFEHRQNANHREIPFELTFEEWYSIWQDSGKWELRGKGKGSYVMSRIGDAGPYKIGNVYINSNEANAADANKGKTFSTLTKEKMRDAHLGVKKSKDAVAKNAISQLSRPKYTCQHCNKLISGAGNLKQHIASKHKEIE
jgi:hypothetical protein